MSKHIFRSFAEKSLRHVAFRRRLPARFGRTPIIVSPSCGLRYLRPDISKVDPTLFALAERFANPGTVVWDVGANSGLFAFACAARSGQSGAVIAFEPDTQLVAMMRKSCALQPPASARVTVVPVACGRTLQPREFRLSVRSRSMNHLAGYGSTQTGGHSESQTVMCIPLDWALDFFPRPDVLKIDVEGAELEVLQGAEKVLQTARPAVICEVSSPMANDVATLLHKHRYRVTDADAPDDDRDQELAPWNTLAVPANE